MKTKLLKKLRRQYSWAYNWYLCKWVVIDHKNKKSEQYRFAYEFIEGILARYVGLYNSIRYTKRKERVDEINRYNKAKNAIKQWHDQKNQN